MANSPTAELFQKMRQAITKKQYREMEDILRDQRYSPDAVGGTDARSNLHTAAQRNDERAINLLLGQRHVDPNIETQDGLTALMVASKSGKLEALEALLADMRVDPERTNHEDQTARDIFFTPDGSTVKRVKAMKLFQDRERRLAVVGKEAKLAILIGNSHYRKETGLEDLEGAEEDVTEIKALLETYNYTIFTFKDSENLIQDIFGVMEKIPAGSIKYLQFFYAGNVE